jgi:FkbM family methyltransferase
MTFSLRSAVTSLLPRRSRFAYRVANKLVNLYNGDNDSDIHTNGELRAAQLALPYAKVVFDVGANVGDWTELALAINPGAQLHCFEPSGPTFRKLSTHGFPQNVRLNHFGLGSASEERTMYVYDEAVGSNSLYRRVGLSADQRAEETVRLATFDDYCASENVERVDFVKIDVEGHELSVLRGAKRMLFESRVGVVQFEYGGCYIDARVLLRDIWQLVDEAKQGYAFYKIFPERLERIPEYRQTLETFQYSNWIIANPEWQRRLR